MDREPTTKPAADLAREFIMDLLGVPKNPFGFTSPVEGFSTHRDDSLLATQGFDIPIQSYKEFEGQADTPIIVEK